MNADLLALVNELRQNKQHPPLERMEASDRLREDLGFESLDLAELTVRIEERFGVDVFEDGLVNTVGEIAGKLGVDLGG
jgi:acyl carrier protein